MLPVHKDTEETRGPFLMVQLLAASVGLHPGLPSEASWGSQCLATSAREGSEDPSKPIGPQAQLPSKIESSAEGMGLLGLLLATRFRRRVGLVPSSV